MPEPVLPPAVERRLNLMERRILDLERRRVGPIPEILPDLRDVFMWYDEPATPGPDDPVPVDGDVFSFDGSIDKWRPRSSAGLGAAWSTWQCGGTWDGGVTSIEERWNESSPPAVGFTIGSGSAIATLGTAGVDQTSLAGVWLVAARCSPNPTTDAVTQLRVWAQRWKTGPGECHPNGLTWEHDGGTNVGNVTVAGHLVLAEGWELTLDITSAAEVLWQVDAHFVAPLAVQAGDCGG